MKKFLYHFIILLFISNCTLNKVIKHHGVNFLEKKSSQLTVGASNKNDIIELLGPPSTVGSFDKDLWIYMEIQTSSSKILRLGKKKLLNNNVLILEVNNRGLLTSSIFLNKEKMNNINFATDITQKNYNKDKFIYNFLSSLRQKINDPLGTKKIK
jgi:outer membrane protein assembly factor BamE (lipoprotein component of BamABCDE complex)